MSRTVDANGVATWDEGDNPGAGSKTVLVGNTGINGNWLLFALGIFTGHTSAGAHKSDVIDGPNLKTTVADASTIQLTGSPLKLSVKAGGIGTTQLADDAVTADKLADGAVDAAAKLAADVVTTTKILDANVTHGKLALSAVEADNISHDNNARKMCFCFGVTDGFGKIGGEQTALGYGIPMPRAGHITGFFIRTSGGSSYSQTQAYSASGAASTGRFSAGQHISVDDSSAVYVSGSEVTALTLTARPVGQTMIATVEVEFDN
jgi:hypothetical protein